MNDSISIQFANLSCSLKAKNNKPSRSILKELSGSFHPGMNAIMGGSGAGKTTFLNILAKKV